MSLAVYMYVHVHAFCGLCFKGDMRPHSPSSAFPIFQFTPSLPLSPPSLSPSLSSPPSLSLPPLPPSPLPSPPLLPSSSPSPPSLSLSLSSKEYIHRVGRTARAGGRGHALLMLLPEELNFLKYLKQAKVCD